MDRLRIKTVSDSPEIRNLSEEDLDGSGHHLEDGINAAAANKEATVFFLGGTRRTPAAAAAVVAAEAFERPFGMIL